MKTRIFVVDHDPRLRDVIAKELEAIGCDVLAFANGKDAFDAIDKINVDLMVIDPDLPDMDGWSLVRRARRKPKIGIVVLAGNAQTVDRIVGLEVGADDYVSKPCDVREVLARIRTVLRRIRPELWTPRERAATETSEPKNGYIFDGWRLHPSTFSIIRPDGIEVDLTAREFKILEFLVTHPNRYWDAADIARLVDAGRFSSSSNAVTTAIRRLRLRLGDTAQDSKLIGTLRGSGYKFLPKVAKIEPPRAD